LADEFRAQPEPEQKFGAQEARALDALEQIVGFGRGLRRSTSVGSGSALRGDFPSSLRPLEKLSGSTPFSVPFELARQRGAARLL